MRISLQQHLRRLLVALGAAFCLFFGLAAMTAQPLWAAEIVVNTTVDAVNSDGLCSLREAVVNANANSSVYSGCAAGDGADTIILPAGTYSLTLTSGPHNYDIDIAAAGALTITGNSARTTIINAGTLPGNAQNRIFDIESNATVSIRDLTITGGYVSNNNDGGGMRIAPNANVTLQRVAIVNNWSSQYGGAIYNEGTLVVSDSLLARNEVNTGGGGLANFATAIITNTTISKNAIQNFGASRVGGGIANMNSTARLSLAYTTVFDNIAFDTTNGANLYNLNGNVTITASVIALDSVVGLADSCTGVFTSGGYNIDSGSTCALNAAGDLSNTDPLFGALVNAGGPTDVHPLQANSPALDMIPAGTLGCGANIVTDQRGEPRPQDGNGDSTAACDTGAFELATVSGAGGINPVDVTVLSTVIDSGNGPLGNPVQPLGPDPVTAGESYRFFVEIENLDQVNAASGVIVHDTLLGLSGATLSEIIPAAGWACSFGGIQLLCTYTGALLGNGSPTPVAEVEIVIDPAQAEGVVTHYLQASTLNPDVDLSNNACDIDAATVTTADDCVTFTVETEATLSLDVDDLNQPLVAGGSAVLYPVVVSNSGPSAAADVVVEVAVPANLLLVSLAAGDLAAGDLAACTSNIATGTGQCLIPTIPAGAAVTFYAAVRAASSAATGTVNALSVAVTGTGNTTANLPSVVEQSRVDAVADLSVTKSGPATVTVGSNTVYTLTVANNGPSNTTGVAITDTLPAQMNFVSATGATCSATGNVVTCTPFNLAAGAAQQVVITAAVDISLCYDGSVTNRVVVSPDRYVTGVGSPVLTLPQPDAANNQAQWTHEILAAANLSVTKNVVNSPVNAGGIVEFEIQVTNSGPGCAPNVFMLDELNSNDNPDGLEQVEYYAFQSTQGDSNGPFSGWYYVCTSGLCGRGIPMPAGTTDTIRLFARVPADTPADNYTNWANLFSTDTPAPGDTPVEDDSASWAVTTEANLSIAKTLLTPGTVTPGGLLQYEIVVTNDGPSVATGLNVTDTLATGFPPGTQIVAASPECSGAPGTQITCAVDNLWPGQSIDFLVTVQAAANAAAGSTIQNCAAVNDLPGGVNQACAVPATVAVTNPALPTTDLELISLSCSPVLPGSAVTETVCTVNILNSGAAAANNVTLAQRLVNLIPQGQSFSATTSQGNVNANTLWNCSTGMDCTRSAPMPAGAVDTLTFRFRTLPDAHLNALNGQPIRVEAAVSAANPDSSLFNNRLSVSPNVEPSANLRVDKVALSQNPAPGSTVLFAVTVYNDGFSAVDGIAIDDVITTGNAAILNVTPAGTVYIAAGASQQFLVTAQIDDTAAPGATVTNQVTVNTGGVNAGLSTLATATGYTGTINSVLTDTVSVSVGGALPDADISVTNTITHNTSPIVAGGLYSFTVAVRNLGPAQAQGVVVHDLLVDLPGAQIVEVIPAAGWQCSGALTCSRSGAMPITVESVATVTVSIPSSTPVGVYRHRLAATAANPDPLLANNSTEIYSFTVDAVTALAVNVDDFNAVLTAGDAPTLYPIQVTNAGPSDAVAVVVTATVAAGFELTALQAADLPAFCNLGAATCTLPTIPAGSSRTIIAAIRALPATLPAANTPVIEACVGSTPICDAENSDVVARADLVVDKRATATVNAGDLVTYTVDILNAGPSNAQNVVLTDTLPAGVTLESAGGCVGNTSTITCTAGTLAAGASQRYTFIARTDAALQPGSSLENIVVATSSTADFNTLNNSDSADSSIVSLAALALTKTAGAATVTAGESVTFNIVVTNSGPSTAQNVAVEDALPAGLSLVEATLDLGNGPQPCGGLFCGVGELVSGASATVRITALAAADLAAGSVLTNTAQVTSAAAEANLADNRAQAVVTVTTQAQITLTKADLLDPVVVNDLADVDELAYVLTVANRGPSAAAAVQVTDTLPAGVSGQAFVLSASWAPGPQPGTCSGASELVCDLGTIPAGEQVQIYVTADVQDAALCGAEVTNQAAAGWIDSDGASVTAPVTAGTGLRCQSSVSLEKSGPADASVGGDVTYVVTVTNNGPSALLPGQLTLNDPTPAGLTFNSITAQSGACAFAGTSPWTNGGTLAAGESCSVSLNYTVAQAACPAGFLFNRAQVSTPSGHTDQDVVLTNVACDTTLDISLFPDFFPEDLVAGNIVDFEITVENTGDVIAYDVELTDNLYFPQFGARIVDFYPLGQFTAGECTNNGFCNLGDLLPGDIVTVVASVEIDSDQAILGESLVKDACAEADNADRVCLADREQIFDELILSDVELTVTKQTLFDPIVVSGSSISADGYYVLEVANNGFSDAFGVVISDTLPLGMVVSDDPTVTASYSYGAFGVDCSSSVGTSELFCLLFTPLPAGETIQIVVPVGFETATAANFCVDPGNSFTNVAEVQWIDDIDGEQSFLSNEVTSNFVCRGDVDVTKSGPAVVTYAEATAGFGYTVTVQNTGPSPIVAGGLTVTDTLPAGIFFDAAAAVDGGACGLATTAQTGDSVVVFTNAAALGAGESCAVVFGVTSAPNGQTPADALFTAGDLFNVATVAFGNDVAQAVWQTEIDFSTQLTLTKQALGPLVAGQEAIFEIVITNTGDAPAFNLLLTDNVNARSPIDPLGARVVGMSVLGRAVGLCSDGGLCRIDALGAQESITVLATVLVDADTISAEARQQACVSASNAPSTCAAVTAEIDRVNDVRIRKDDLGNVLVAGGAPVQFIITVWNESGPSTAYDVVLRDDMFPGFVLVGDLEPGSQRVDCPNVPNAGDNLCIIRTLRPGDSVELYATVAAEAGTAAAVEVPVNQACIVEIDGVALTDPLCDTERADVVTRADVALVKNAPATVGAGDLITYTIDISNLGPSVAQNVVVTDNLPAELSLLSVSASLGGCNSLPCALGTMPPGSSAVVTIIAAVDSAALVGSSIENVATVSTSTPDPNASNDSDDADTSIVTVADLRISKQTNVVTATAGLPVTYTLIVSNAGPGLARNVQVQDALPAGLTLLSATVTPPAGDPFLCAGMLCTVGDLDAGQSAAVTLVVLVDTDYTGATITNRATVTSLAVDPFPADNDSGPLTTPVTTLADVSVEKRALANPVGPQESFLYEIVVRNAGPSDAQLVNLVDTLDANVTFLGASNGWLHNGSATGGVVNYSLGSLPAGSYAGYVVAVRAGGVISGTQLINTVVVNSATADPVANNSATALVTVQNLPSPTVALSLSKRATASSVRAGETITYSLVMTNAGPQSATNVTLLDLIPAGTQVVTMTANNAAFEGEFCGLGGVCNLGTLPVGGTATVNLVLAVESSFGGDSLTNQAQVTSDQNEVNKADNVAGVTVAVTRAAELIITKADLNDPVLAGETILYQISVENAGPSDAVDVRVEDALPVGASFAGMSANCFDNVREVICDLGDLAAGERASVFIEFRTNSNLPNGATIFNTATVSSPTDPTERSATVMTTVNQSPLATGDLILSKQADVETVIAGGTIRYTLVVTNAGPTQATNVIVVDALPSGVRALSVQASQGICNSAVTCVLGDLPVKGTATVTIVAAVPSNAAGVLENRARVSASNPDANGENNQDAVTTPVTQQADLAFIKRAAPEPATPGTRLTYEIVVTNAGPSDATAVTVDDPLPAGFALITVRSSQARCSSLPCALGTIPAGESASVTLVGMVAPWVVDALSNTAAVTAQTALVNTADDSFSLSTPVSPLADLFVQKIGTPTVNAGEAIAYTIRAVNQGPSDAQNVSVVDSLPSGLTVTGNGGCTLAAGALTCLLGTLAAGQTVEINLSTTSANTLTPGTRLENRVTLASSTADRTQADNVALAVTNIVGAADLRLSKSGPATVLAGTEIEYTIVVTNAGPSMARGVDVKDALPAGMTLIDATIQRSGDGLQLCGGLICQLGEMALGESAVMTVRALVSPNLTAGTRLTNTAAIFGVTEDVNPADNSAVVVTVVSSVADIAVSVLDLSDPVQPTGGFVYDIALTNNGPSMARGVVLTDVLDVNVSFASISPVCPLVEDVLTCNLGNLAVGETVRFLLAVTAADVPNGTLLLNTVTATTSTPDPVPANNSDTETTTVQLGFGPSADLGVSKSASLPIVEAGNLVTYTIVVSNAGPADAADVKLIEVIPAGARLVQIGVNNPSFASATCALSGLCLLGKMPVGVNVTVTATLLVETSYNDTVVNNLVTVISDLIDPRPGNNIAAASVEVIPFVALPSLRIEKELQRSGEAADGVVPVGERIVFTITLANNGQLQLVDMPLIDTYDATKLSFVSASTPPSRVGPLGTLLWDNLLPDVASLAPGDSFQVTTVFETVGSSATSSDGLTENRATVNAAEGENGETAPAVSAIATVKVTSPSVEIRKTVDTSTPAVVLPGDLITYTITVSNTGDTRLTTIPVIDRFEGDHLSFVSAQIPPTAVTAEEVSWADVGDLDADEVLRFTVTFRVIGDVPFVDNVAVLGVVVDENGDVAFTPSGQAPVELGIARLGFELDALPMPGTEIRPGDVVTYYLRLLNRGGIPLTNVTLVTQVPEGTTLLTFAEVPSPLGGPSRATPVADGSVYEWNFGTLAINQAFETLMIVQVNTDTTLQAISMDANYSSAETAAGQSNELIHPLSPTAITLESFTVEQTAGGVLVRWKTAAEVNTWGFYVLRSVYGEDGRQRINPTLIPATGAGSVYEYLDSSAAAGTVYEYWLQEVELDGDLLEYGPTLVGQGVERLYLPMVRD